MKIESIKISKLKAAPYNPRTSTAKQEDNLKASLEKFGVVEPVVYNKQTGNIVGGHFRVRELKKMGVKEVPCVVVDLSIDDEKELNIRLNANTGEWDWEMLANEWDTIQLAEWGLDLPAIGETEKYTSKIEAPTYEPTSEKPSVDQLINQSKAIQLIDEINKSKISDEDKQFLILAAKRHVVFDFQKIAEYYCHASEDVQTLMEKSALVIIDYSQAIENGFAEISHDIQTAFIADYEE